MHFANFIFFLLGCIAHAEILNNVNVVPESLLAGVETQVLVSFVPSTNIAVGSIIIIAFPTGFKLSEVATTATVISHHSSELSGSLLDGGEIRCEIYTDDIPADDLFEFTISTVTNPASSDPTYSLQLLDAAKEIIYSNNTIIGDPIITSSLSSAAISFSNLAAGEVTAVTISIESPIFIPIGSIISLSFPNVFLIQLTKLIAVNNLNDACQLKQLSQWVVTLEVAGDPLLPNIEVGFQFSQITNPGAMTTTPFKIMTTDSFGNPYTSDVSISGITTISKSFSSISLLPMSVIAGVTTDIVVTLMTSIKIPSGGYLVFEFPSVFRFPIGGIILSDLASQIIAEVTTPEHRIQFQLPYSLNPGEFNFRIQSVINPGVQVTNSILCSSLDEYMRELEYARIPPIAIIAGVFEIAKFSPVRPHPGIISNVELSFQMTSPLQPGDYLYITLPLNDYKIASLTPTVTITNIDGIVADVAWDEVNTALLILISGIKGISENTLVLMNLESFEMPSSIRQQSNLATIIAITANNLNLATPSSLLIDEIVSVKHLDCNLLTETNNPGIKSKVVVRCPTSGAVPVDGKILIQFPSSDLHCDINSDLPFVYFHIPHSVTTNTSWDALTTSLIITIGTEGIPAEFASFVFEISVLSTPESVRSAGRIGTTLTTLDATNKIIDGPSIVIHNSIDPGMIIGTRIWSPLLPYAGITCDHRITFTTTGKVASGGKIEFTLSNSQFTMPLNNTATFETPILGNAPAVWTQADQLISIKLPENVYLPPHSQVSLLIPNIANSPKVSGYTNAVVTTRSIDDGVIDGPGIISVDMIQHGQLTGKKIWTSTTSPSASLQSDQLLEVTLNGALPNGSKIRIEFPPGGWRLTPLATLSAEFVIPANDISVVEVNSQSDLTEVTVRTVGDLPAYAHVQILFQGLINPYSSQPATTLSITTMLPDSGIVDYSNDITINEITCTTLPVPGVWLSTPATPGISSHQKIDIITGGSLESGSILCITLPSEDMWQFSVGESVATLQISQGAISSLSVNWDFNTATVCFTTKHFIPQESSIIISVSEVITPPSIRISRISYLTVYSHLGGCVNKGLININEISSGLLSGPLTWQSKLLSPGTVASLVTSGTLLFQNTGKIPVGGSINLQLPASWTFLSACRVSIVQPTVQNVAICLSNEMKVHIAATISENVLVEIVVNGVVNPPKVQPATTGLLQTFSDDGGLIDEIDSLLVCSIDADVTGIYSTGDTRVAVAGVLKTFQFEGHLIAPGDILKFVDGSTSSDDNCGETTSGESDVGGVEILSLNTNNEIAVKFTQSSPDGNPFLLCYKFGANPFKLYSSLYFVVKEVRTVSVSDGQVGKAVAGHPKRWKFSGSGLSNNDYIRWIDKSVVDSARESGQLLSIDCNDPNTLATLEEILGDQLYEGEDAHTRKLTTNNEVKLSFSSSAAGKTLCLCYKFGNEPYTLYTSWTIFVHHLTQMEAITEGSNSIAIAGASKLFRFLGNGVLLDDRVYFVEASDTTSCDASMLDDSLQVSHTFGDYLQSVLFINSMLAAQVNFTAESAGRFVTPCYQFGIEHFKLYPNIKLFIKMVASLTGTLGSQFFAVANVPEPLTFLGHGLQEGDKVRWIRGDVEDCESELAEMFEQNTLSLIDTIRLDSTNSGVFNFSASQQDFTPSLCYQFGTEVFKLYSNIKINIGTISAKAAKYGNGAKDVAIANARKAFVLFGTHLSVSDRVGWTADIETGYGSCQNLALLVRNPIGGDDDFFSYLKENETFEVALASLSSGKTVRLCYGFGSEPLKLYSDLVLNVKSILNVLALKGSNAIAIAGAPKTFLFEGDGVSTGDFAKFVADDKGDCSEPGISLATITKEIDDVENMALFLAETMPGVTTGTFRFDKNKSSAGLARVLCYQFGAETFFYYDNFRIDVKTISQLQQVNVGENNHGDDSVAVVNERKLMFIDGVGISNRDQAKFVDPTVVNRDSACEDAIPMGLVANTITVFSNSSMWFPFEYGSQGISWILCYKFDDEPYMLYENIFVEVKEVAGLLDLRYHQLGPSMGKVSIVNQMKTWIPIGSGIRAGDAIKFVSKIVVNSAECGEGNSNTAGGSSVSFVTETTNKSAEKILVFSMSFTLVPPTLDETYHLCYKFQHEPYTYVTGYELQTYSILSINRKVLLASATTPILFNGFRISDNDKIAWVIPSDRDEEHEENYCNSRLAETNMLENQAIVVFDNTLRRLQLCYSFDNQPFSHFPDIEISIVEGEIWVPKPISVVSGVKVLIEVTGTFGLTVSSDQVAWIPTDVSECSVTAISTYSSVMQSTIVSTEQSMSGISRAGVALLSILFESLNLKTLVASIDQASIRLDLWKLCYRFGNTNDYYMFDAVTCQPLHVEQVDLILQNPTDSGIETTFQFHGIGIQDFDLIKWVSASKAITDDDCLNLPPIRGSKPVELIRGVAKFEFVESQADDMALCYKFVDHDFKLYSHISITDATLSYTEGYSKYIGDSLTGELPDGIFERSTISEELYVNNDVAIVQLTLNKDFDEIQPIGLHNDLLFRSNFEKSISQALNIDLSRIRVLDLIKGSIIVQFEILPSQNIADPLVHEIVDNLRLQLNDTESSLFNDGFIVINDINNALEVDIIHFPPTQQSASFSIQPLAYQPYGIFQFATRTLSATEKVGRLTVQVLRSQGLAGPVSLQVFVDDQESTALYGYDYEIADPEPNDLKVLLLRFEIGDTAKTIEIKIFDDQETEAHFESVKLKLLLDDDSNAALGTIHEAIIRIYDDDGSNKLDCYEISDQQVIYQDSMGFTITGNARNQIRIDKNGLFAVDEIVGKDEYHQECDMASPTGSCTYACELGAGLVSTTTSKTDKEVALANNVLQLLGDDYVVTVKEVHNFPSSRMTISFWIKPSQFTQQNACIMSYSTASMTSAAIHLALCNPHSLALYIMSNHEHDYLNTFVNINDGSWHFIAILWDSEDGRVHVYDNSMKVFDGGPFRVGITMQQNGFLVVGQLVLSSEKKPCISEVAMDLPTLMTDPDIHDVLCDTVLDHGFVGQLQHIHIWNRVLNPSELLSELKWPMRVSNHGLILQWNFDSKNLQNGERFVQDLSRPSQQQKENLGLIHCGMNSLSSQQCIVHGSLASIVPHFPCGKVYENIWHFVAPNQLALNMRQAYGGRLHFRMLAPSHNGLPRPRRGHVSLFGGEEGSSVRHISAALRSFPLPRSLIWTHYTIILREDFGWIAEPSGRPLTYSEFKNFILTLSAVWIRGDLWGYSTTGHGQEVVYINSIVLEKM